MEVRGKYLNSQALEKDIRKEKRQEGSGWRNRTNLKKKKKSNFRYFHKCVQGQPGSGT